MVVVVFTIEGLANGELSYFRVPNANNPDIAFGTNDVAVSGDGDSIEEVFVYFLIEDPVNGGLMMESRFQVFGDTSVSVSIRSKVAYNPTTDMYLVTHRSNGNNLYSIIDSSRTEVVDSVEIPCDESNYDVVYGGDACNCFVIILQGDLELLHYIIDSSGMGVNADVTSEATMHESDDIRAVYHPTTGYIGITSYGNSIDGSGAEIDDTTEFFLWEVNAMSEVTVLDSVLTLTEDLDGDDVVIDMDVIPGTPGTFLIVTPDTTSDERLLYITSYRSDDNTFKVRGLKLQRDDPEQPAIAYGPMSGVTAISVELERARGALSTIWVHILKDSIQRIVDPQPGQCGRRL